MSQKQTLPRKDAETQRKLHISHDEQLPVSPHAQQQSVVALQPMIGNQAVQRLMHKTNRAPATPAIQRVKTINEDVIVNGELAVGKSLSAQNLMAMDGVLGSNANFTGEVLASKFTPNGLNAGAQGGAGGGSAQTTGEPTGGDTDLSDFGLEPM